MRLRTDRKFQRQQEAIARFEAWQKLSPQEQLASLDERRGESKKQREKIQLKLNAG